MKKFLLRIQTPAVAVAILAIFACAPSATAQSVPQREVVDVAVNATTTWTIPHYANARILSVQQLSAATNGVAITDATIQVKHLLMAGTNTLATNTLLAAGTNAVVYAGSALPAAYAIPGDQVTVKLSNTNAAGKVAVVIGGY
jgi:ABC-type glycerol-3-phosphate transport system substrate-binding protein